MRISCETGNESSPAAKAGTNAVGFMRGLKPPPPSGSSFSKACERGGGGVPFHGRSFAAADEPGVESVSCHIRRFAAAWERGMDQR